MTPRFWAWVEEEGCIIIVEDEEVTIVLVRVKLAVYLYFCHQPHAQVFP